MKFRTNGGADRSEAAGPQIDTGDLAVRERVRGLEAERRSLASLLALVRTRPAVTRLDLERLSGMGRAIVTDRLATLSRFDLIDETAFGRSIGGRTPRLVRFRSDAGRILVANIDRYTLGVGLADLGGQLVFEHYEATDPMAGPTAVFRRLDTLFAWALDQEHGGDLWGIALGVPDAVETRPGERRLSRRNLDLLPSWGGSHFLERIIDRLKAPIWVRGSVQMAAMGEFGTPRPERDDDLLYVEIGTEIGAGFITAGRLHRGAQGVAGQIGHVFTGSENRIVCRCGNAGCLETVVGGEAIAQEGLRAARDGRSRMLADILGQSGTVTVADIGTTSQLGDAFSSELLSRCGRLIGTTLATLTNALNPSTIVIGGEVAETGDILLAAIREGIYRHSHPLATRDVGIVRSRMGRSAGLVGAALVAVDEIFTPGFVEGWITSGSPLRHPDVLALLEDVRAAVATAEPPAARPPPARGARGRRERAVPQ
jgi:predicted NBD/HSP70 family sugar kinase